MQSLFADLHIHTVLSPCAEIEMIPPLIVHRALELELGVIAITDHNRAANAEAVVQAAEGTGLTVLPGMEVQTREEVHMLCLFDRLDQIAEWERTVLAALPDLPNAEEVFGAQYVVDATGEHLYTEEGLLSTSTTLSVEDVAIGVNHLEGICLAAHVDRPSYSLLGNLGMVPPGLGIDGLEISCRVPPQKLVQWRRHLGGLGFVISGDAHRLNEMGARTRFTVASPTVAEIGLALKGQGGRCVELFRQ